MPHILSISSPKDIRRIMQDIKVDPYGIKIMLPKAITHLVKIDSLPCILANILKQELLSLGADAAVSRDALSGKIKKTGCLLIGNLAQFNRLVEKLKHQPFGLNGLAGELSLALKNYQRDDFILGLRRHRLNLSLKKTALMGIINLTPDSFSGDGLLQVSQGLSPSGLKRTVLKGTVPELVEQLVKDGADIIDIGGESSRPGAKAVSAKEEINRVIPVLKLISKRIKIPISIDTYKTEVAKAALDSGAEIVNDISGLRNPLMAKLIARYKAAVVIMHMQGDPRNMQKNPRYKSLIEEIIDYLDVAVKRAVAYGISRDKIIIDPGIGFGKLPGHNLEIINNLKSFKVLGLPVLAGPSRKSFIGYILKLPPEERIFGTLSACVLAAKNGANILRVHDLLAVKQALKVADSINNTGYQNA